MRNEMMAKIGNAVSDWLGPAKSALAAVREAEESKRYEYDGALARQAEILNAPPPRSDVLKRLREEVAQIGAAWLQSTSQNVIRLGGQLEMSGAAVTGVTHASLWDCVVPDLGCVCALYGDVLITKLSAAVERLDYPQAPPMAERARLLRDLAERIGRLAQEHEALCHAAAEQGIPLPELRENHARRVRLEREAEQRRIAELYAKAHAKPGPGVSPQSRLDAQLELERRQRGARP